MNKLGFNFERLLKEYPQLIICSISGYGQTGPDKLRAGHDINYISRAGLTDLMKTPDLPPIQIADLAGGAWPAAFQIIAALYHRNNNSKKGCLIDVSMTDCSYGLNPMFQAYYNYNRKNNKIRNGNFILMGGTACYGVYPCKDGYISFGCLEPKFWKQTCIAMNAQHLIQRQFDKGFYFFLFFCFSLFFLLCICVFSLQNIAILRTAFFFHFCFWMHEKRQRKKCSLAEKILLVQNENKQQKWKKLQNKKKLKNKIKKKKT